MRRPGIAHLFPATAAAALVLTLSACGGGSSGDGGAEEVSGADLRAHVEKSFTPDDGVELEISCPEPLAAEKDATATCTVKDGESQTGVRFTTTSVEGDEVSFDALPFLTGETVGATLTQELGNQGFAVDSMKCPDALDGTKGATTECAVTSQGQDGTIAVEVTDVDGLRIGFNWEVRK